MCLLLGLLYSLTCQDDKFSITKSGLHLLKQCADFSDKLHGQSAALTIILPCSSGTTRNAKHLSLCFADERSAAEAHTRRNAERVYDRQLKQKRQKYDERAQKAKKAQVEAERRSERAEARAHDSSVECECSACTCTLCTPVYLKQKSIMQQGSTVAALCDLLCSTQSNAFWSVLPCLQRPKQQCILVHMPFLLLMRQ
jgi:hypothetical protein